ncbi:MAG: 16S rRNA (guanine(527)-N(7))-methyltransferase RsmG [Candidatus Baltobacteraceae bacterium]
MEERSALAELLRSARVSKDLIERIAQFGAAVLEANRRFNLTGAKTPPDILPHLLDSLTIVPYVSGPLVDIGSGAGLPAIVLAIATGIEITLIESTTKKAVFLETMLDELDLRGRVVPQRAELAGRDPALREYFACGTGRAISSAPAVAELLLPFLRIGGVAVMQRGAFLAGERDALVDAAPMLGGEVTEEIPLEGERCILLIRKAAQTPPRFPRRIGVPEKRPLCFT